MSNLMNGTKKTLLAAAAVATLATGATVMPIDSAEAQWRGRHGGGGYAFRGNRGGRGIGVAAGIIGGLAAGALIAGASRSYAAPSYGYGYAPAYQPSYGYVPAYQPSHGYAPAYSHGYQPTYYGGATYAYQPTCYTRRVRQRVDYDTVVIRRVRVCN